MKYFACLLESNLKEVKKIEVEKPKLAFATIVRNEGKCYSYFRVDHTDDEIVVSFIEVGNDCVMDIP